MKPINARHFEHAAGLQTRSTEDTSGLNLQTQCQLIYGKPGANGRYTLANMTLYAPDGMRIIMMEQFEPLTSAVDCNGDDGTVSLTFKSQSALKHAIEEWSYINDSKASHFILIANHAGCGPDDERKPYIISGIRWEETTLTTSLVAQPAPWSEVAGTYDLDFGKALVAKDTRKRRNIATDLGSGLENIGQAIGDGVQQGADAVVQAAKGDAKFDKSVTFSIALGEPKKVTKIVDETTPRSSLKVDCVNCFVTGSFKLTGHLSVKGFKLQDLTFDASPKNVAATIELSTTITGKDSLQFTKELVSAPIPDAGIEVPGIFKLGAIISYEAGVSATFAGNATFQSGLSASLPDAAKVVANINTPKKSSATGFDSASVKPLFKVQEMTTSVTVAVFTEPKLSFGIELTKIGKFDVNINIKLPKISATLTAEFNETGACSQEAGASKTGVDLSSDISVEVDLDVDAQIGDDSPPKFSQKLAGISKPLFSRCFPLDIPGLKSVDEPSALPVPADASDSNVSQTPSNTTSVPANQVLAPAARQTGLTATGTAVASGAAYENGTRLAYFTKKPMAQNVAVPEDSRVQKDVAAALTRVLKKLLECLQSSSY